MSGDFLDPNDPLNLLLSSAGSETLSDNNSIESSPQWPDLDSMLVDAKNATEELQYPQFMTDEEFAAMSFDQSMLGFPGLGNFPDFPFSFNSPFAVPAEAQLSAMPRRLSIGSASTSSSLSPIIQPMAPPSSVSSHSSPDSSSLSPASSIAAPLPQPDLALPTPTTFSPLPPPVNTPPSIAAGLDPLQEIARLACQSAGIALALQGGQAPDPSQTFNKLPIPRLTIPEKQSKSPPSSKRSTPAGSPQPESALTATGRPRTSHTTIERRYRTNLNSRIQSLRMAVPALRVLDKKNSAPNATAAVSISSDQSDVIDERGFIDGVKVARKCSKANVLGKAVEYIRVLKKREARLTRERDGLKSLLSGLVGGPVLLREWEREWAARFGGPETDEVEDEELDGAASSDEDEDDEDEESGRKRKKVKLAAPKKEAAAPKPATSPIRPEDGSPPERRKRGRPRKVVPPIEVAEPVAVPPQATQPAQYLLAVFAVFSFLNSSPSSWFTTPATHQHTGHVLTPGPVAVSNWGSYQSLIQTIHLLASIAALASVAIPLLRPAWAYVKSALIKPATKASSPNRDTAADRKVLLAALAPSIRGSEDEGEALRDALGVNNALLGISLRSLLSGKIVHVKLRHDSFELQGLEQRAWARLGELGVIESSTGVLTRLSTYLHMSSHVPPFSASISDLVTLSLLLYPLSHGRAQNIWDRARRRSATEARAHERIVVQTLSLDDAASRLSSLRSISKRDSPLVALSAMLLRERICDEAKNFFVQTISSESILNSDDIERRKTFEAARSFGGHLAEVAEVLERACGGDWVAINDGTVEAQNEQEEDVLAILSALSLYYRTFPPSSGRPGIVLTPPPSPGRQDPARKMQLKLRRALGAEVFERRAESDLDRAFEDAKDMVVDLLTDARIC